MAKAFDTVNHKILLKKLGHYGIRGTVNDFFRSYLTNTSQFVSINNSTSSLMSINVGVPQGSTLGLLLFLLYINDLPNSVKNVPRLFADDTCLLVGALSVVHLENQPNSELIKIFNWLVDNKLTLNTSKFGALVITPKLRCPSVSLDLQCHAGIGKTVDKAKYLGTTMNNQLNFGEHIKNIENKIVCTVGILSKWNYFLPDSAMLQLYYSLVHPHILYGVAIWGNAFPTYLAKLSRLQNKAIRLVTASD